MAIDKFRGDNYFLSNMYPLDNGVETPEGIVVPCSEIAYLPERFVDPGVRSAVLAAPDGFAAKRITRTFEKEGAAIRPDWDAGKLIVMRVYVGQKFDRNPELAEKLLATGSEELIEGNSWGDRFWGVSPRGSGKGQNHLGRILMETRDQIRRNRS